MRATGCIQRGKDVQAAVLLHCVREQAGEIYETFELDEAQNKNVDEITRKFDECFLPRANKSIERHRFNTRVQMEEETFHNFIKDLQKIAANCSAS